MDKVPSPFDYGLPENVEEAYKNEMKRYADSSKRIYREKNKKIYIKILAITFTICFGFTFLIEDAYSLTDKLLAAVLLTFGTTGWGVCLDWIGCVSMKSAYQLFFESDFYKKYHQYKSDIQEYNRRQQVHTQAFWLDQTGHQFETEVAKVYQTYGYKTTVSKAGGDGGIDIVLTKGKEKIAVQCKHHAKPVSPAVVRDLYGTILANGYSHGILVSLRGFTQGTKDFAKGKPIELIDMNDLIRMSNKQS